MGNGEEGERAHLHILNFKATTTEKLFLQITGKRKRPVGQDANLDFTLIGITLFACLLPYKRISACPAPFLTASASPSPPPFPFLRAWAPPCGCLGIPLWMPRHSYVHA